jgi:hypothetical protein
MRLYVLHGSDNRTHEVTGVRRPDFLEVFKDFPQKLLTN